ncbi:MAG TPA: LysM peptidoglycan-binding domain-containing protein, partial [Candidatus Saccharimonadales bacterium]
LLAFGSLVVLLSLASTQIGRAAAIETSGIGALPAHPRLDNPRTKSIFIYDVAGADVITDGIKVVNNTDTTKTLAVYPVDSQASSDGAFACAQKVDPRLDVGTWIKLAQNQVTLAANSVQVVPFTLTVPNNVKAGEHNGCIVVQDADPATKKAGNGIVLSFRSALRVSVTTPGALSADLSFVGVKSHDINKTTLGISPLLQNKGNVSADANIEVKLRGIFGLHYPFASVGGQFPVFPGQSRFNFELKKPYWGGWYRRDVQATYKKPLPSGELSDNVTTIDAKNAIIFIMPKPLALVVQAATLLVIVALFYGVYRLWRRLRLVPTETYTIEEDDSIESIASNFAIKWQKLAKMNGIEPPYTVHPGRIIKVPLTAHKPEKTDEDSHTSHHGDTESPHDKS